MFRVIGKQALCAGDSSEYIVYMLSATFIFGVNIESYRCYLCFV